MKRPRKKDPAAVALGKKGGNARMKAMRNNPKRRTEIARAAAKARWAK